MKGIKSHFTSHYIDGTIIEADYRQLEIRVLALASRDLTLIQDINDGVDLHTKFAAQIFSIPESAVTSDRRKLAKGFSFQLQYGAGAKSIAEYWKVDVDLVRRFIDAYYNRYPLVKQWQDDNLVITENTAEYIGDTIEDNGKVVSCRTSTIPSIWDLKTPSPIGFNLREAPSSWSSKLGFMPTKVKNYPIQGGAADIMHLVLGELSQVCLDPRRPWTVVPIGTVHDSIVFDTNHPYISDCVDLIKTTMENVPALVKDFMGVSCPVEFPVDVTTGKTWADQQPYKFKA